MAEQKNHPSNVDGPMEFERMPGADPKEEATESIDLNFPEEIEETTEAVAEEATEEATEEVTEETVAEEQDENESDGDITAEETTEEVEESEEAEETEEAEPEESELEEAAELEEEAEPEPKKPMVPKSRLDEVLAKQRKLQEQLDAFLTNVYRQFHRWRSEQLEALTADNLQPELEEDFRQSAQQDTMQYVQDIHDQIDEINERYENLVDENTSEEQGLDLMQKKHEELEALPTSTKREWEWFHRPPWVDKYFNEIFETYKRDNLSELLSDIDAAGQLDTMFASTRPSSIPMEPIHIDQLNYPTGSTHIPANAAGGIDVDDNNEALIKSVPLQLQFPPRRFFQRGSGMYKSIPVSPVYLDFNTLTLVMLASSGVAAC